MAFHGMSVLAIVLAAIASYAFGAVWYMTLAKTWQASLPEPFEAIKARVKGPAPFIISFVANLVMAWVLAGLIGHIGPVTVRNGIISALFVWLGFVAAPLVTNHAFQGNKRMLTLIDGGHWLGALVVQGLVIGLMGA